MVKSILIVRPGAVGDFIVSLPALEYLSSQASFTAVWCPESNLPLVQFAQSKRSIVSAGLDRVGVMHCDDVLLRLAQFDAIHCWYGAARTEFRDAVRALPFRFYDALPLGNRQHATEFYSSQVGCEAGLPRIVVSRVVPPDATRDEFFILHPFASSPAKRWPLESFRELGDLLGNARWCAGPEDMARYPDLVEHPVVIEDLYELAKWISTARAYIGNDSGITHLAAAVGTPVVALFGPTDPAVWAPRGPSVHVMSSASTPQQVAAAVHDLL